MTAEHPNRALIRRLYEAMAHGDLDLFRALHAPDVVLHVSGHRAAGDDFAGRDALFTLFRETAESPDVRVQTEVHDLLASDDHAVALVRAHVTCGGDAFEQRLVQVFHIREGKVAEIWEYLWDQEADRTFWSTH
jgi:ketosteroid isomerase-like protein